ncbi:unnamed protein product [Effrenium voratum]|uniref:Uncharacterized protein n=1 Tax=Effrenium voratum TaxID=2562239 RepID=A0AA36J6N7_9DINO|nr:unnamed protein product [Effrenium voratum]
MINPLGGTTPIADYKTELNQFLQRHCKKPLTKSDIVYTCSKFDAQCQAIVKLNCLDGQEYAGHLCYDQKSAEKSAAEQALQANILLVQATKAAAGAPKRANPSAEDPAAKKARLENAANPADNAKTELNSMIGKIAKKVLLKGETVYVANKIGAEFQATVQSSALPGEWAERAWAGELAPTKQKAEQSAAAQALQDIKADEELMAEANKSNPKSKGSGGGGWGSSKKADWAKMMAMMKEFMKSGGKALREPVGEDFVTGECVEWKGKFGWIKPDIPVEHDAAKWRDGKVWVSMKDLIGVEELAEGQRVLFKIYAPELALAKGQQTSSWYGAPQLLVQECCDPSGSAAKFFQRPPSGPEVESVELQWLAAFVDHCKAKGLDSPILQQLLLSVLCEHAEADPHGPAVQGLLDESARLPQELASRICEAAKGSESSESPAPCFLLPRLSGALVTLTALDSHELAQDLGPDGLLDVAKSATVASSWTATLETSRPGIRQELCEQEKDQVIQNLSAVWKALGKASATGVLRPSWERRLLRSKLEELKDRLPKPMRASVRDALVSWGGATKSSSGVGRLLEYISWGALGFLLLAISSEDGVGILRFHVVPDAWQPLIKETCCSSELCVWRNSSPSMTHPRLPLLLSGMRLLTF